MNFQKPKGQGMTPSYKFKTQGYLGYPSKE